MEHRNILLIDDDRDFVHSTKTFLEGRGYRVDTAFNGSEGLGKIRAGKPDLIVLDVMMDKHTDGFDLCPTYQAFGRVDLAPYETIMMLDARDGVTGELVTKLNAWLKSRPGLLYVCGDVNSRQALLPAFLGEKGPEKFVWEDDVQVTAVPPVTETVKDKQGEHQVQVPAPLGRVTAAGGAEPVDDSETRLSCTYAGKVTPLLVRDGKPVLAVWHDAAKAAGWVLLDGARAAGPIYTGALEAVVKKLDADRGSTITRNPWWGHVVLENDQFVIDVATSGYGTLQAARPRQHRGVDIITGDINPLVKSGECALVLKNYVGPYAGGLGDWAVMARTALKTMRLAAPDKLEVAADGVVRVSHLGEAALRLEPAADFTQVDDQLLVWKAMWAKQKTYSLNDVPGGRELHFWSPTPVTVSAAVP